MLHKTVYFDIKFNNSSVFLNEALECMKPNGGTFGESRYSPSYPFFKG